VSNQERELAEKAVRLAQLERERAQLETGNASLQEQLAVAQRRGHELFEQQQLLQKRTAAGSQQLQGRLATEVEARQRAEAATAAAREALADVEKRLALDRSAWERRLQEVQEDAGARLTAKEAAWANQLEALQREAASVLEETRRQLTKRLYLAEGEWARKLQQMAADWGAWGAQPAVCAVLSCQSVMITVYAGLEQQHDVMQGSATPRHPSPLALNLTH
jgi:hypothetical protein